MGHDLEYRRTHLALDMDRTGWDWFNTRLPVLWVEDTSGIVAYRMRDHRLVAGCVYDNWTQTSVQCHLLIEDPYVLRTGWLQAIYRKAFGDKRLYIYGLVPGNNDKALRLNKHMGFTEKCRLEEGYGVGVDYVIMQMKREDCRYL